MKKRILAGKTVSRPFHDGQKLTDVVIKFNVAIKGSSVSAGSFEVKDRNIIDAFCVSDFSGDEKAENSQFIRIKLNVRDDNAYTSPENPEPTEEEKKAYKGNDRLWFVGRSRRRLACQVTLLTELTTADGETVESGLKVKTSIEDNREVDRFRQFYLGNHEYNLFIPESYDENRRYPLVLFIGDATSKGDDHHISLECGLGPTCWLGEDIQKKDPCFVLVPVFPQNAGNTNNTYVEFQLTDVYYQMCREVEGNYSIDPDRIYTTGQSMGCMNSYELMFRYPHYFAAALCVSGHWDRWKIASCAKRGQIIWSIAAEEDGGGGPSFRESMELLDEQNIPYQFARLDGNLPVSELSEQFEELKKEDYDFRFTFYEGKTSLRVRQEDECHSTHYSGWWLTYRIKPVLNWLLQQRRKEVSDELY